MGLILGRNGEKSMLIFNISAEVNGCKSDSLLDTVELFGCLVDVIGLFKLKMSGCFDGVPTVFAGVVEFSTLRLFGVVLTVWDFTDTVVLSKIR